jgi:pimeloyl-ACP methyl ester carboxylesterase
MVGRTKDGTAYVVEGDGPPVVLVHGMGLNRDMWDWQLAPLAARFRVLRYDLLGHGDSADPPAGCRLDDLVGQLHRLLDEAGIERCALVGFSLGGMIVRAYALAHPERTGALAILNSAHDRNETERAGMRERLDRALREGHVATIDAALERWFTPEFAEARPDVLERVRRWMEANDPAVYPVVYRVLAEGDAEIATSIAAIRCPTLVLACEGDPGNSPDMSRRMAALIPGARTAIIPRLRHMALAEDPQSVSGALVPFLEEVWGG